MGSEHLEEDAMEFISYLIVFLAGGGAGFWYGRKIGPKRR